MKKLLTLAALLSFVVGSQMFASEAGFSWQKVYQETNDPAAADAAFVDWMNTTYKYIAPSAKVYDARKNALMKQRSATYSQLGYFPAPVYVDSWEGGGGVVTP